VELAVATSIARRSPIAVVIQLAGISKSIAAINMTPATIDASANPRP
jgi:hypothetical protein